MSSATDVNYMSLTGITLPIKPYWYWFKINFSAVEDVP